MRVCEEHDGCIVVFDSTNTAYCPVCSELEDKDNEIEYLENEISELDGEN